MALNIIFMGTPEIAAFVLGEIAKSEHKIIGVYTQPPRPAGRKKLPQKSPTQKMAEQLSLPVFTPQNFKQAKDIEQFKQLKADVAIIVAYGLLLPKPILDAPKFGCLNLHASLLPRWRGAAPIQRAIMAGDKESGIMIMKMDEGLDTGPIALAKKIKIKKYMIASDLHEKMKIKGAKLVLKALKKLENNELKFTPQAKQGATYAKKISKSETRINWNKEAKQVLNHIRGLSLYPGAWFEMEINDKAVRVKILRAKKIKLAKDKKTKAGEILDDNFTIACARGAIRPILLQREGKRQMEIEEFLRGINNFKGRILQ